MTDADYRKTLEALKNDLVAAEHELGTCIEIQEDLEKRIASLRETAVAMSRMLGESFDEMDSIGLTDVIRQAFKAAHPAPLAATEVRDRLRQLGFDITKYGNVLASVHTVVNRLEAKGEIRECGTRSGGQSVYVWIPINPPAPKT